MWKIAGRIWLFVGAHVGLAASCLLIANAGGDGTDGPRFSTHAVPPFATDDPGVAGRFYAGACDDGTPYGLRPSTNYVPGEDAYGYNVPPADTPSSHGAYASDGYGYGVTTHLVPIDPDLALELESYGDYAAVTVPDYDYTPCPRGEEPFIDK